MAEVLSRTARIERVDRATGVVDVLRLDVALLALVRAGWSEYAAREQLADLGQCQTTGYLYRLVR